MPLIAVGDMVLIDGGHIAPLTTQHDRVVSEVTDFLIPGSGH